MAQFIAIEPSAEVNGQTVLSVVKGMGKFSNLAKEILERNGIQNPTPGEWYLQQNWLNAFKEISENVGEFTLKGIGRTIPENADWPPHVNSIESALASIDVAYHMNHRIHGEVLFNPQTGELKEGIGHYRFEKTGEREITMICDNPYPCAFDMGIIESAAQKFKTADARLIIQETGEECRKKNEDKCTYSITW